MTKINTPCLCVVSRKVLLLNELLARGGGQDFNNHNIISGCDEWMGRNRVGRYIWQVKLMNNIYIKARRVQLHQVRGGGYSFIWL